MSPLRSAWSLSKVNASADRSAVSGMESSLSHLVALYPGDESRRGQPEAVHAGSQVPCPFRDAQLACHCTTAEEAIRAVSPGDGAISIPVRRDPIVEIDVDARE